MSRCLGPDLAEHVEAGLRVAWRMHCVCLGLNHDLALLNADLHVWQAVGHLKMKDVKSFSRHGTRNEALSCSILGFVLH